MHEHEHGHDNPDHGAHFDNWSCRPTRIFDAGSLRAWLRDVPAGVLRLKGVLRTGGAHSDWCEIQFAGRHGSLRTTHKPVDGAAALVAIGLRGQLPVAMLETRFAEPC